MDIREIKQHYGYQGRQGHKEHYGLFESSINNSLVPRKSESAHPCRVNLVDSLECLFTSLEYLSMYFSVSYQLHFRDCAQIGRGPLVGLPLPWSCSQTDNEAQIGRPSAQSSVNPSAPKYLAKNICRHLIQICLELSRQTQTTYLCGSFFGSFLSMQHIVQIVEQKQRRENRHMTR